MAVLNGQSITMVNSSKTVNTVSNLSDVHDRLLKRVRGTTDLIFQLSRVLAKPCLC